MLPLAYIEIKPGQTEAYIPYPLLTLRLSPDRLRLIYATPCLQSGVLLTEPTLDAT